MEISKFLGRTDGRRERLKDEALLYIFPYKQAMTNIRNIDRKLYLPINVQKLNIQNKKKEKLHNLNVNIQATKKERHIFRRTLK